MLEKLIVIQLIKKFSEFVEPKDSFLCSQKLATGPYPKPDESSPHTHTL
jgi:hypothetical protein